MEQAEAERIHRGKRQLTSASGGLLMFALSVVVSAGLCSVWLWQNDDLVASRPPAAPGTSTVALVESQDLDGALSTLTEAAREAYRNEERTCSRPLAWVALAADGEGKPAMIRLRSGTYYSPVIPAAHEAKRVAVPLPAPYEAGRGQLVVLHEGGRAHVALQPVLHIPDDSATLTLQVTWPVDPRCVRPNE